MRSITSRARAPGSTTKKFACTTDTLAPIAEMSHVLAEMADTERRLELQVESKNIFNTEQVVGVFNRITVDADGYPLDAAGNRMDPSTISTDQSDYVANSWREQRKLQIGLKFLF